MSITEQYEAILAEAHEAATDAIAAKFEQGETEQPFNCGFAWVTMPATSAFARFLRQKAERARIDRLPYAEAARYGDRGSAGGWRWWKPGTWPSQGPNGETVYGQDMDFHEAGARAFADVLNQHGFNATVGTRLD